MKSVYYPADDILELHFGGGPVVREESQDWNVHISYDADGNIVEMVILDARAKGLLPVEEK